MDVRALIPRVIVRYVDGEAVPSDSLITEALQTVHDRLAIRLKASEVPQIGASIVVDAAMKVLRRGGYEGSSSESVGDGGSVSVSFVENVLSEYDSEISSMCDMLNAPKARLL